MALQVRVDVVRRSRRSTKVVSRFETRAPVLAPLPPTLERLFGLISLPVSKLDTASDGHMIVREISILLGDVLDVLEEDQRILRAADALYGAAFALHEARDKRPTCANITASTLEARATALSVALAAFRRSLLAAAPNARARVRRIGW